MPLNERGYLLNMSRLTDALDERFDDLDEMKDVVNHGMDAGFGGFIYYGETREFFFKYEDEILEVIEDDEGFTLFMENSDSGSFNQLINAMVWHAVYDYCWTKVLEAEEKELAAA